jgi:hypothetical protein
MDGNAHFLVLFCFVTRLTEIIETKIFTYSLILITIISCDYLNLSLTGEHVDDVTIPTQVIESNQHFLQSFT